MRPAGSETRRITLNADTDLPQPDSPTSATVSPSWMSQDTSSTARTTPPDVWNVVWRFLTSRRVAMALGYRVCSVKGVDLGRGEAEFGEHLAAMLAEGRRRPPDRAWRGRELDRQAQRARAPGPRVLQLHHHFARHGLRIGRHVGDRVDRA